MDIQKALRELYAEKKRLDSVITALESKVKAPSRQKPGNTGRRGRRSMNPAERQEVSKRMTDYWAAKRAGKQTQSEAPEFEAKRATA